MRTERLTSLVLIPAICATLFFAFGLYLLTVGHPHEDAYILFIYAENLARDGVISYFEGGPPTEGATDFLWMVSIAAANALGIGVASAALILNTVGAFLLSLIINKLIDAEGGDTLVSALFAALIPLYAIAQAAYAGFSSALYASVALLAFYAMYRWDGRRLIVLPALGLVIGLLRPDGVIIGASAALFGVFLIRREHRNAYLLACGLVGVAGAVYFWWRWSYFGEFLPLPLYVKSQADSLLPGLYRNFSWTKENIVLVAMAVALFLDRKTDKARLVLAGLPPFVLLVALVFAYQSQNVSYRFQAPAAAVLLALAAMFMTRLRARAAGRRGMELVAVGAFGILAVVQLSYHTAETLRVAGYLTSTEYSYSFPYLARNAFSQQSVLALTEAGRFAYWVPGKKYDLVGLNDAYTARHGADPEYIARIDPDVIFLHVAGTVDYDCPTEEYCVVGRATLLDILKESDAPRYDTVSNRVRRAPLAAFAFLEAADDDYVFVFARFRTDFDHFYAIKRSGNVDVERFLAALKRSFTPEGRKSYWRMKTELQNQGELPRAP